MPYHLLTGSTGLLGTYLLRDNLRAGRQIAVLVRSSIVERARQRIENVLVQWEQELGYALPRPPVLEADLCKPDLGIDRAGLNWIARNCVSVLHNAASLSFEANERSGEPYRSNVDGTRNVLDLCRKTGIRRFHHVSTAYVCGLRTGCVSENELDVGQPLGNDYEKSKVQAEKLVREADFLDPPTIYRPAIIVGDSHTGYTTTFHGFYTPLKIGQAIVDQLHVTEIYGEPLMAALGLSGVERKNLVPVDWVSEVITYLYGRPDCHGRTYHLTPERPVPVSTICAVAERALSEYARDVPQKNPDIRDLAELQAAFAEQMEVYRAYWRDDPEFDRTDLTRAAPHLPCPNVDFDMLLRTSRYALKTNFGWPRRPSVRPEFDVLDHLEGALSMHGSPLTPRSDLPRVGMQINGPGGGQWTLLADRGGAPVAAEPGITAGDPLLYVNAKTFHQLVLGEITVDQAAQLGRLVTEGNSAAREQVLNTLRAITAGCGSDRLAAVREGPAVVVEGAASHSIKGNGVSADTKEPDKETPATKFEEGKEPPASGSRLRTHR
jgi:thioester reductase-like protein